MKQTYIITKELPKEELYGLSSQMRRSAVSVSSNIAEGYKRKNRGEYLQFLSIAEASVAELETQFIILKEVYEGIDINETEELLQEVQKMLFTLIKKLETSQNSSFEKL